MSSQLNLEPQVAVSREETQQRLDRRAQAAGLIKPQDHYTLADRLEEKAARQGEHTFLIYGEQRFSYAEVNARANQVAHAAQALGLKPGDVCALAMENRPEFFSTWFGLTKIGVVVAFINTQVSGRPLRHALDSTQCKVAIVGEECAHNFAQTDGLTLPLWLMADDEKPASAEDLAGFERGFSRQLEQAPNTAVEPGLRAGITAETPTLLIFTSGTTGLPKAAIYSHMRWLCSGDVMEVTINATAQDVFYCCLPLYHGAAATSVTSTALKAGAAILVRRKFSVSRFWQDVRNNDVTVCQYIGEICRYLLNQEGDVGAHRLRCMMGAGLTAESWRRWVERFGDMDIYEGWGATEANTNLINVDNHIGSCGRVPDWNKTNFRLIRYDIESDTHVRDAQGRGIQCGPGEVGEGIGMIINHPDIGGGRFEGYTSKDASEQKILRDVFVEGDAYWRSGDLLRHDDEGYFYFVDRIGDTFRWKSENVSTQEVANALADFSGVELINIYGVQVPEHEGRAGMAAIVMQPGHSFDPAAFYALTELRVPRYAAPLFVRVSAAADMTTTFKLRKVDLQRQGYDPVNCPDPLYVRDDRAATYKPYSAEALAEAGLPPFEYQ
ncbi:long-chain-acyl-CoA synthetase [Marinobacterium rhizophilum]|uniref:Long-chain-acyl-CoA synthetase n=1 Tax=Marinobacterium rhizophilum TaxID=420402 RepID=A0ABY5HJ60_9GAMM|nr:long-chain-acyl-CoA synthetase [Marinobacterium rhizophilum]UTW12308.1 long-chain-acyl-CoA synthetase [Marinobacterium rhizophilum]